MTVDLYNYIIITYINDMLKLLGKHENLNNFVNSPKINIQKISISNVQFKWNIPLNYPPWPFSSTSFLSSCTSY